MGSDTYARKHVVIEARRLIDHLLVRDSQRHNTYIHAPFCRKTERLIHSVRDDQIRCRKVNIALHVVYKIYVYTFTRLFMVQW